MTSVPQQTDPDHQRTDVTDRGRLNLLHGSHVDDHVLGGPAHTAYHDHHDEH